MSNNPADIETAAPATVLCVDDDPHILSSLRRLLRGQGYRMQTAESGPAALLIMEQEPIDVVISDMHMPGMDGAEFLGQVRERWPSAIRLLLTGRADVAAILDAVNCGEIYRYITKPWDDNDLPLVIRQALERHALIQERELLEKRVHEQNEALRALNGGLQEQVALRTSELKASHDAVVIANDQLKINFLTTIKILSSMIEMRGGKLAGHSRRVADLARRIAVQMRLDDRETQEVFIAGLLHDIGKIGFPDELLALPVNLIVGDHLGTFRKHPLRAEQLLMPLEDLRGVATILRAHMERFDGAGFPDAISGASIPIGARILALASDYDNLQIGALVQRRLGVADAKQLIYDSSGKRYDASVVAAFRVLLDGEPVEVRRDLAILASELLAGMVLARDLVSREGLMLLSAETVLDARRIQQVQVFEEKSDGRLMIWVWPAKEA